MKFFNKNFNVMENQELGLDNTRLLKLFLLGSNRGSFVIVFKS